MAILKNNGIALLTVLFGVVVGYFYYAEVGCLTGKCPITSNPYLSSLYGGVLGYFIGGMFKTKQV